MNEAKEIKLLPANEVSYMAMQLRQELRDQFLELKTHMVEKPLCRKEAAEFLGLGLTAFDSKVRSGKIPARFVHTSLGVKRFLPSELKQCI